MYKIIEEIKLKKMALKMTNKELSIKSGVPLGTVNKILSQGCGVKSKSLEKINSALSDTKTVQTNYLGFVKVGASTIDVEVANVEENVLKIKNSIDEAMLKGVKVLAFQNMCITGATCGDLFYQQTLLESAKRALIKIKEHTLYKDMLVFISLPLMVNGVIYKAVATLFEGEILGFTPYNSDFLTDVKISQLKGEYKNAKILFDGKEYIFASNVVYVCNNYQNFTVSVYNGLKNYETSANIIVNCACSNEVVKRADYRRVDLMSITRKLNSSCVYANSGFGESTTDYVFSGHNIICENGKILKESKLFNNGLIYTDIDVDFLSAEKSKAKQFCSIEETFVTFNVQEFSNKIDRQFSKTPFIPSTASEIATRAELILSMQSNALAKRINHIGCKNLVIGVSGGLDSTLALLVCVRAFKLLKMDLKGIIAVTMPCFGTTKRTKSNAEMLANTLNVTLKEISIKNAVLTHFEDIGQNANTYDVTYENSQARERTQVLMDIANKVNGIVIGTGDLSELALGWATYNGDHMSNYAVNSSIPKTLIRHVVEYEANRLGGDIKNTLYDVLLTPVSPELLPPKDGEISQKTEDIVGPYILHDFYLYYAIRACYKPSKIFKIATITFEEFDKTTLLKWLKNFYNRFFSQQFKRSCLPDGVKIGSVGVSPRGDLTMPSDAVKFEWLEDLKTIKL